MQKIIEARIKGAEQLKDESHVRSAVLGIFRIVMQHACVSLGEWIAETLREQPNKLSSCTNIDLAEFYAPSDGALVDLLSQLLVAAENVGWRSVGRQYWEQFDLTESLKQLVGRPKANIETVLGAFVRLRNNGVEGHGLPGGYDAKTDVEVIRALTSRVSAFLPASAKDGVTLLLPALGGRQPQPLKTLKLFDGDPICYRKIRKTSGGRISVEAQIQRTLLSRDEVTYESENVLLELPKRASPEYKICEISWTDGWSPFIYLPDRLASSEVFTGRVNELNSLADWADDEDSKKCMVHGDGGVGKTTLVVEFIYRLLEGKTEVNWRPELITFYTAKKTRWGLAGLEHISAQDIGVADAALDIARMLTSEGLDRSWFDKTPKEIIQKLSGLQSELKIRRDDHLIVLDNTETMARDEADVKALAQQINELSRRVGRVILTSRRREQIEAHPIRTDNWIDEEGAEFLRKRGEAIRAIPIMQAGESTLRQNSRNLGNKPIALEVFAQAAAVPGMSLKAAFDRVQMMQRQDLGQFLFDDAWARLSTELRQVLLLMSRVGDSHDQYMMQLCCRRVNVTVAATSDAIEESRGIATITRFEGDLQIVFNPEFFNYCIRKFERVHGRDFPLQEDVDWVQKNYAEFIAAASAEVFDRNMRAFRVPPARAAWKCFKEGDLDKAVEFYEVAILADSENGWLFDRYAYTLFQMKKYPVALNMARRAIVILPGDDEAWFTKGMIESRMSSTEEAVADLERAASFGKQKHLCEMQKAYAYVYANPPRLVEAKECFDHAVKMAPKDKFLNRFTGEATRFQRKWFPD